MCGEREGLILETPYEMGDTLNGTSGLDIDAEKKLMEETLKELRADNISEEAITLAMKDLGIQRFYPSPTRFFSSILRKTPNTILKYNNNMPMNLYPQLILTNYAIEPLKTRELFVGIVKSMVRLMYQNPLLRDYFSQILSHNI